MNKRIASDCPDAYIRYTDGCFLLLFVVYAVYEDWKKDAVYTLHQCTCIYSVKFISYSLVIRGTYISKHKAEL